MNKLLIENQLQIIIENESGLDQHRDYLGISKVAECPRRTYHEFFDGVALTPEAHRFCYAGYFMERDIWRMLIDAGIAKPETNGLEVVSGWNPDFRGHIDGLTVDHELLEIKSVSDIKWKKIQESDRSIFRHYCQVQLYMKYLGIKTAYIIYRNRETFEHKVFLISYRRDMAEKFEQRAKDLFRAIETKTPPACECGYCKK